MKIFFLIVFFIELLTVKVYSQLIEPVYTLLDMDAGLPSIVVYDITQDKQGYMWFGTANGLCRFDGFSVKTYFHDPKNENSIPDQVVYSIGVDKYDNIWIGTQTGLCIFDKRINRFYRYNKNNSDIHANYVGRLAVYDDIVFFRTENGLFYATDLENLPNIKFKKIMDGNSVSTAQKTGNNTYIFNKGDFYKLAFDSKNKKVSIYDTIKANQPGDWSVNYYSEKITFTTFLNRGLNYIENDSIKKVNLTGINSPYEIRDVKLIDNKWLLLLSSNGLYLSDGTNFNNIKFTRVPSKFLKEIDLSKIDGRVIYQSKDGTVWVSLAATGILSFNFESTRFKNILIPPGKTENEYTNNSIKPIIEDVNGNILFGTVDRKIVSYNPKNEQYTYITEVLNKINLKSGQIIHFCKKNEGSIYASISTSYGGIAEIECKDNKYKLVDYLPVESIYEVCLSKIENSLWVAAKEFYKVTISKNNKKVIKIKDYLKHKPEDEIFALRSVRYHPDNEILIAGAASGLYFYYLDDHDMPYKYVRYTNDPSDKYSISHDAIRDVIVTKDKRIFVATDYGLNELVLTNDSIVRFINYNNKPGMPKDKILSIIGDNDKNIWINTFNGLVKYNYTSNKSSYFNKYDGLIRNELNEHGQCLLSNGNIIVGTFKGASIFNPKKLVDNKNLAVPIITKLNINYKDVNNNEEHNGRIILNKDITYTDTIVLTKEEKSFSITFSALHFTAPQNIMFKYKLEGFDNDFIIVKPNENKASYSNLKGGDYTFIVMAANNDGVWNQNPAKITLIIKPPFWKKPWFIVLAIVYILGVFFFIYKTRTNMLKRQKRVLEIKVKERTTLLEKLNARLEERQEEVLQQNEEIQLQKEIVEEQHAKIEKAFQELSMYENELEILVENRTKELEIAKQKAEESDKLKSSFLANLSHEIRTPLNAIVGFSGLLVDGDADSGNHEMFKSMIQSNSDTLLNLIDDILDFSKIEAGQIEILKTPVYLSKIVSEIKELYTQEIEKHNAQSNKVIEFRVDKNLQLNEIEIFTDENRLKQIMHNLINNAIKFTPEGYVEFGYNMVNNNKFIEFYVKDTGIGINKENHELIFRRFRKIEGEVNNVFRGTGLGLSICQHLVKLLGGQIWVDSELGKGSVFHFTIPLHTEVKPDEGNFLQKNLTHNLDFSNKTILLAEDDESNYILTEILLKKTKASIIRAVNGFEAVEMYNKNRNIDIVLMDIKMPVMDGFEALKHIKSINPSAIIIAQTAHAYEDEIDRIVAAGFSGYILKPINLQNLFMMLEKYLKEKM